MNFGWSLGLFDVLEAPECVCCNLLVNIRSGSTVHHYETMSFAYRYRQISIYVRSHVKMYQHAANVINVHLGFVRAGIIPVCVFDGIAPINKNLTKEKRKNTRLQAGADGNN